MGAQRFMFAILIRRYQMTGRAAVRTQLRDAGVYLAQVLNGSLGG